jgi:6-phosphogluconolactonase
MPPAVIVDELPRLAEALVGLAAEEQARALSDRGLFAIALSGGSAGTLLLPSLARAGLDWLRTEVFWADERAVPPDHPESNYGMARRLLLEPAAVPVRQIHRVDGQLPDLERAAASYADELARTLGTPPRLDLALLGVGPDGHVASLFPGHPAVGETELWVRAVPDAPKPPPRRLTLTLPVLAASRRVVVFARGREKADAVRAALAEPTSGLPVALLARAASAVSFLLDADAASRL